MICRFDSINVQFYNNEGSLDDGSDFSKSGTDEALAKALDDASADCWDDYTYGWYRDGKKHCLASKFLTTALIWADVAQKCTEWRSKFSSGETQFVFGTAVDQLSPDGSSGGLPWPVYTKQTDLSAPRRQIKQLIGALSKIAGTSFGGVMLWDRGNDNTVASKMPENVRPSRLFKESLAALSFSRAVQV